MALTEKQKRFAFEYVKDFNATRAAERAGYSERSAHTLGSGLLQNVEVLALIEENKETLACVAQLSPAWVLRQWMDIASANPADLVRVQVRACSACWPDNLGIEDPNVLCELCGGKGICDVVIADTRKLSPRSRRLYAGAEQKKDGIRILMRDQDAALGNLARYLGMLVEKKEVSGPGGGPVQLQAVRPEELTDEQLAALAASAPQLALSGGSNGGSSELSPDNPRVINAVRVPE